MNMLIPILYLIIIGVLIFVLYKFVKTTWKIITIVFLFILITLGLTGYFVYQDIREISESPKLLLVDSTIKIFGRNIYPTENPEPHGYGIYITLPPNFELESEIQERSIPGGPYAVVNCDGLEEMGIIWPVLWKWVENSEYQYIGETKGEYGFELGFEEYINWYFTVVNKSESKILFDLMLQLREE